MTNTKPLLDIQRQIQQEFRQFQTDIQIIQWRTLLAGQGFAQIDVILANQCHRLEHSLLHQAIQVYRQNGKNSEVSIAIIKQELANLRQRLNTLQNQTEGMIYQALRESRQQAQTGHILTVRHKLLQASGQLSPIIEVNMDPAVMQIKRILIDTQKVIAQEVTQTIQTINNILRR